MARTTYRRLKAGSVLSIPIDGDRIALGHVIDPGSEFYLCVYAFLFQADQAIPALKELPIALIGRTTDALLWHGRWTIVGHQDPPTEVPRSYHVIHTPNGLMVRTFHGVDVRRADENDLVRYGHHFSVSPITFTHAMQDIHGIASYDGGDFSRITFEVVAQRSVLHSSGCAV